jgi:16S rRNA (guanine527-N7)-methyltransferase
VDFAANLHQAAATYGLNLTPEQLQAFTRYYELLLMWNEKMNLTAITDPAEVAVKHMVDSLSVYDNAMFPSSCRVIDVGTGAGFPGLPLKILRSDLQLTLLDSLQKRLNFLQAVIEDLGMTNVDLVHARAEDAANQAPRREYFQVATSRAVARLNILCELCLPFVAVGGVFIAMKGAQYQEEVTEANKAIILLGAKVTELKPIVLPGLEDKRAVIYIQKQDDTPAIYPRRPGIPEKKPL